MSELDAFPLPLKRMIKGREDSGLSSKHIPCPHFSYYKWSTQTTHCLCLCLQYVCSFVFVLCVLSIFSISSSLNFHTSHHSLHMAQTYPPTPSPTTSTTCHDEPYEPAVDFNIMVIVAAILCAFVCALGLNSTLQCVFRCANRALTEPVHWVASRRLNSGLKKKEMVALPTSIYANSGSPSSSPSSASGCAICLMDFKDGDNIRVLPKCNHRFHVVCIDKWLLSHSSCPTCRHRLKSSDCMPPLEIATA